MSPVKSLDAKSIATNMRLLAASIVDFNQNVGIILNQLEGLRLQTDNVEDKEEMLPQIAKEIQELQDCIKYAHVGFYQYSSYLSKIYRG